jgi:IS1 family transposase
LSDSKTPAAAPAESNGGKSRRRWRRVHRPVVAVDSSFRHVPRSGACGQRQVRTAEELAGMKERKSLTTKRVMMTGHHRLYLESPPVVVVQS